MKMLFEFNMIVCLEITKRLYNNININMYKIAVLAIFVSTLLISCVSQGTYDELALKKDAAFRSADSLQNIVRMLNARIAEDSRQIAELRSELQSLREVYQTLKDNSSSGAMSMISKLEALQKDLAEREKKFEEIRRKLNERDKFLASLRERIQKAMAGVEEGGLSVYIKDGKLYVSLSNKLLFKTGSTVIDQKGLDALSQLAEILNQQTDLNVLVEGHTDNQPVLGQTGRYKDNWDLSVLRATEVVRYLTVERKVDPKRIIASGRSEYFPIESGDAPEARSKNRRTEIILTPNIDILFDIFNK